MTGHVSGETTAVIVADFTVCANCGADAEEHCWWDSVDGWHCDACGGCDADE